MSRLRERWALGGHLLGAALLFCAAPALAKPREPVRLEYARGPGSDDCPGEDAIRSAVAARLGYDPFRADARRTVTAKIARSGRALRADVTLRDAAGNVAGTRQLSSLQNDCGELAAAMALVISIAIDPQSELRAAAAAAPGGAGRAEARDKTGSGGAGGGSGGPDGTAAPSEAPAGGAPASETQPPETQPQSGQAAAEGSGAQPQSGQSGLGTRPGTPGAQPQSERGAQPQSAAVRAGQGIQPQSVHALHMRLSVGSLVAAGDAPGLGVGFTLQAGLRRGALSLGIEGRGTLPASEQAASGGVVSASFFGASLLPCLHRDVVLLCALGTLGALRGSGSEVSPERSDVTPFAAAGVRGGTEIPLGRAVSARIYTDVAATLTPTTLRLSGQPVWTTWPITWAFGAAAVVNFL